MNDCVFSLVCEWDSCKGCKCYMSMNEEPGYSLSREYDSRMENAYKPVVEWLLSKRTELEAEYHG